jgi:hypothetical protein
MIYVDFYESIFKTNLFKTSARLLEPQMILNGKLINYIVVILIEIYNFSFGRFSIKGCLKIWFLKF